MSQTLGRPKRSFMVGFPAELSWLKGNEEVGRRDVGVEGMFGGEVGDFQGGYEAGVLPFDLFRAAKREGAQSKLANTFSG